MSFNKKNFKKICTYSLDCSIVLHYFVLSEFALDVSFMFLDVSFVLGCFVCVSICFWMFHLCPCVSISVGKLGFHYVCWWLGEKIKFSSSNAPLQN